jgi:hypothetical protein
MARGPKGKPVALHLVDGTFKSTRHAAAAKNAVEVSDGSKPVPPYKFDKEHQNVWDFYAKQLWWNSAAESDLLALYVDLTVDKRKQSRGMATKYDWNAAMLTAYKSLGSELGVGFANKQKIPPQNKGDKNKESEHFD